MKSKHLDVAGGRIYEAKSLLIIFKHLDVM